MAPKGKRLMFGFDGVPRYEAKRVSRTALGRRSSEFAGVAVEGRVNEANTGLSHSFRPASRGSRSIVWTHPGGKEEVISPEEAKRRIEGLSRGTVVDVEGSRSR